MLCLQSTVYCKLFVVYVVHTWEILNLFTFLFLLATSTDPPLEYHRLSGVEPSRHQWREPATADILCAWKRTLPCGDAVMCVNRDRRTWSHVTVRSLKSA